jgi:hypothetical protein
MQKLDSTIIGLGIMTRTIRLFERDPIGFTGGFNLYRYVRNSPLNLLDPFGYAPQYGNQSDHSHPPASCHSPSCFWYYGNWGGPGWSGGQWKPLEDLTPEEQSHLAPPIDAQDACYQEHDYCYSRSRVKNKCTAYDHPSRKQAYEDDQDTALCDWQLARCLDHLGSDPSKNPAASTSDILFELKAFGKWAECDPDNCPTVSSKRPLDDK